MEGICRLSYVRPLGRGRYGDVGLAAKWPFGQPFGSSHGAVLVRAAALTHCAAAPAAPLHLGHHAAAQLHCTATAVAATAAAGRGVAVARLRGGPGPAAAATPLPVA